MNNAAIPALVTKLLAHPDDGLWLHESVVSRYLGLKAGPKIAVREKLTALIKAIEKGHAGNKKKKEDVATGIPPADLGVEDSRNGTNVRFVTHGRNEKFAAGTLSNKMLNRKPRYFAFGKTKVDLKDQVACVRSIMGLDPKLPKTAQDRRKNWVKFWRGEMDDGGFRRFDVPVIALEYQKSFDIEISEEKGLQQIGRRSFKPEDLDEIEETMKDMLAACNQVGSARLRGVGVANLRVGGEETAGGGAGMDAVATTPTITPRRARPTLGATVTPNTPSSAFPDALRLKNLKCRREDGSLDISKVEELASVEYLLHLLKEDMTADAIPGMFQLASVGLPKGVTVEEVSSMSGYDQTRGRRNVAEARTDMLCVVGIFQPKEEELLYEWVQDGRSYSQGLRVQANNYTQNKDNHRPQITVAAAVVIRHIMYSYNLPLTNVCALWALFYVLIMGRSIPLDFFSSSSTIWAHVRRLDIVDSVKATEKFKPFIQLPSKYGFRRYFYYTGDDSKHFDVNRHVLIVSDNAGEPGEDVQPSFRHLTSSASPSKGSDGNSGKNVRELLDKLGLLIAAYLGGGITDNATDAQLEILKTFDSIMALLKAYHGRLQLVPIRTITNTVRPKISSPSWAFFDALPSLVTLPKVRAPPPQPFPSDPVRIAAATVPYIRATVTSR